MVDFFRKYISNESELATWVGVVGTLILGVLALFGEQIRKFLFKPNLKPIEIVKTEQQVGQQVFIFQRLIVKNTGQTAAKGVRILLTYEKGAPRNFIPVPLAWTHWPTAERDVSRFEPAYVDILRKLKHAGVDKYDFCWPGGTQGASEKLLKEFDPQHGNIRLEFFEQDRKISDITLKFSVKNDVLIIG